MRIVLDTNVAVSGLLDDLPPPGRVLEMLYTGEVELLYDERIFAEYLDVLSRPKFKFGDEDISPFLTVVRLGFEVIAPPLPLTLPDATDLKFLEVAVAGGADAIVTGNLRDFKVSEGAIDIRVVTPRQFLEMIRRG